MAPGTRTIQRPSWALLGQRRSFQDSSLNTSKYVVFRRLTPASNLPMLITAIIAGQNLPTPSEKREEDEYEILGRVS